MDMVLYSLIMGKINSKDECMSWNGIRISVVDSLPEHQVPNTIYLVKSDFILPETDLETEEQVSESEEEIATE